MAFEALEDGVVLAIHGEQFGAVLARRGHDEFAGEDEDFLGGEREGFAGVDGGERGLEARGADDGDEDGIRFGETGELGQAGESADEPGAGGEGAGLPADLVARADIRLSIPMHGDVESLNLAVSAGIILYEAARQRGGGVRP